VVAAIGRLDAEHEDLLAGWLEAAEAQHELSPGTLVVHGSSLELDFHAAKRRGGCYHDTFADLYGETGNARAALRAAATIFDHIEGGDRRFAEQAAEAEVEHEEKAEREAEAD